MELVGFSAGGPSSGLAGLGTCLATKNKCVDTIYSHGASYKKPKIPVVSVVLDLSAGSLSLENVRDAGDKPLVSWKSDVDSVASSVGNLSDVENMVNMVAKETSFAESGEDDKMDNTTPRKTCTCTYLLGSPPKQPSFGHMNDDDSTLELPPCMFSGSNQLPLPKSRALGSCHFKPIKSFALDVDLSAVPGKSVSDKLISVKKIFYQVDGFGGAFTPSKFPEIIKSTFISKASMNRAKGLAVNEKILVNNELRKVNSHSNWEIVVKEILVNLSKSAVESVFSKFVKFKSAEIAGMVASKWLVFMGKDSVRVALATEDKQSWVFKDWYQALLYTLPVETMTHDLSDLLEFYNGKTCFIGRNPVSYTRDRCAIVCFDDKTARLAAVSTILIFKGVSLHWTSLVLASCAKCEQFGHIHADCSVNGSSGAHGKRVISDQNWAHLAGIYKKKSASIACPVLFGGKTWAQVASGTLSHVFLSGSSGYGLRSGLVPPLVVFDPLVVSHLSDHLAILECSLELLADCVSGILVRLDSFGVVFLVSFSLVSLSIASAALGSKVDLDMIVDNALSFSGITPSVTDDTVVNLSASGSKVFTAKVNSLETKLVTLEASVGSVLDKLNLLYSGLGLSALMLSQ
ncbi:hypothetical protein G9A89_014388 [Geosiphon pyriformis]|nr:hypothetical protein G9A89_014388 [Geosiphon pyriformis]